MKLLLVEDERLTREGILKAIHWDALGIGEVREAVDGLDALEVAAHYEPDIVLTDVRMPRMDGVESAFQLRRMYPHCKIIFLSGYADKSYLKAAISLQAVSYVEKPVEIEEVEEALRQAVALSLEEKRQSELDAAAKETIHRSSSYIQQEAALELLRKGHDEQSILHRLELSGFFASPDAGAACLVLKLNDSSVPKELLQELAESILAPYGLNCLAARKDDHHMIIHLIAGDSAALPPDVVRSVCRRIAAALKERSVVHSIAAGPVVAGLPRLYESYMGAVMLLQMSFFLGPYSVMLPEEAPKPSYEEEPLLEKRLHQLLAEGHFSEAQKLIEEVTQAVRRCPGTLVVSVKELYYRLVLEMEQIAKRHQLPLFPDDSTDNRLWELVSRCQYLDEVQELLLRTLSRLKDALNERGGATTVAKIMRYIHLHYADDDLSVMRISGEMQMTASHLIAIFKETTGTTVKQYLMEYRVNRAKELLADNPKLKVFDIASQVGYKDGENFAKMFRKFVGMTPSEYRERYGR